MSAASATMPTHNCGLAMAEFRCARIRPASIRRPHHRAVPGDLGIERHRNPHATRPSHRRCHTGCATRGPAHGPRGVLVGSSRIPGHCRAVSGSRPRQCAVNTRARLLPDDRRAVRRARGQQSVIPARPAAGPHHELDVCLGRPAVRFQRQVRERRSRVWLVLLSNRCLSRWSTAPAAKGIAT